MMRMVGQLISAVNDEDDVSDKLGGAGGAGLVIDYGSDNFSSNSFRVCSARLVSASIWQTDDVIPLHR